MAVFYWKDLGLCGGNGSDPTYSKDVSSMSDEIDDTYVMTFGKHEGAAVGSVPASYLLWCHEQQGMKDFRPELYSYIKKNLKHLQNEARDEGIEGDEEENFTWRY